MGQDLEFAVTSLTPAKDYKEPANRGDLTHI